MGSKPCCDQAWPRLLAPASPRKGEGPIPISRNRPSKLFIDAEIRVHPRQRIMFEVLGSITIDEHEYDDDYEHE
jgi:hypothetical protein